ncbi:MAG TPA: hypothetical protein PKY82_27965 [Pyrinomonadaceae bacterium]|nr:hypothetical protein [Pyrinomonadaceae bacterium]
MMKNLKKISALILFTSLILLTIEALNAKAQTPKFKVGDHIEFTGSRACIGDRPGDQQVGTITEVVPGIGGRYVIQPDTKKDEYRKSPISIPIYYDECGMRLAANNQNNPANGGNTTNQDNQQTKKNDNAAGEGGAKFKEGDRIEFSQNAACLGEQYSIPTKGTIIQVNPGIANNYVILADPLPGQAPKQMSIPLSRQDCAMRALGGAAPKFQTDKLLVDENNTVLADRELLDCDNLKHTGRNGSPPPVDLVKKLIRCLYEQPSPNGQDGATRMDILDLTIGAPHRWNRNEDMGQGNASTLVYPVHVKWNQKTFYRSRNVETTGAEMMFTCFADTTNLWQCGGATGPHKDGKTQEIMVKK